MTIVTIGKVPLGSIAKDSITGFTGVVIAITYWMNGCNRYCLQPRKLGKDGKPIEELWFDEQIVVSVRKVKSKKTKRVGGPQRDPKRR